MSARRVLPPSVMDPVHEAARIHDTTQEVASAGTAAADGPTPAASTGERAVAYHCPYCADEDLRPLGPTPGSWHCRTCTRAFSVKYLGMQSPTDPWPPASPTIPDQIPTGGSR